MPYRCQEILHILRYIFKKCLDINLTIILLPLYVIFSENNLKFFCVIYNYECIQCARDYTVSKNSFLKTITDSTHLRCIGRLLHRIAVAVSHSLDCRVICIICLLYLFNCTCFMYVYMNIFLT